MKKTVYIILFTLLGVLLSFLVHALLEMAVIKLLVTDFEKFGLGLSWDTWYLVHTIGGSILFVVGVFLGFTQGLKWWRIIYIEKRFNKIK